MLETARRPARARLAAASVLRRLIEERAMLAHTRIRFHGVATYEIINSKGQRILLDPFFDQNPKRVCASTDFDHVDLVVVSHAAFDHLGDADRIAAKYGCPVVCGGEVKAWLMDRGIPATQIRATTWGIRVKVAGIEIQPLRCDHWSQIRLKDGSFISGVPMAFIVQPDENLRFYHYGDTALFSDMKLQAELYRPNVGCIGIANPQEILHLNPMPGEMLTGEMSPYEGVLATKWLGLETVFPCHYITLEGDRDVDEYMLHHRAARARGEAIADPYLLRAGDWAEFDQAGRIIAPAAKAA
jgi:L-ascorbate metabolism protein UlaG (beta-lactamase superfamily)